MGLDMKKIKQITHTDFDGVGSYIVAKGLFPEHEFNVEFLNYDRVNDVVAEFIRKEAVNNEFDLLLITDLSVSDDVALLLRDLNNSPFNKCKVRLLDHHASAKELNKYDFAKVNDILRIKEDGMLIKSSGTSMIMQDYVNLSKMLGQFPTGFNEIVVEFAEIVRMYDTWQWFAEDYTLARDWNDLLYLVGHKEFISIAESKIEENDSFLNFSSDFEYLLKVEGLRKERYIKSKEAIMFEQEVFGYKAGVVYAEQYQSELGNELSRLNPHLDFIAMINPSSGSISFRTTKTDIDLGKDVTSQIVTYGKPGGGHPPAAGAGIEKEMLHECAKKFLRQI